MERPVTKHRPLTIRRILIPLHKLAAMTDQSQHIEVGVVCGPEEAADLGAAGRMVDAGADEFVDVLSPPEELFHNGRIVVFFDDRLAVMVILMIEVPVGGVGDVFLDASAEAVVDSWVIKEPILFCMFSKGVG